MGAGSLFIISGPSGAGKGTLVERLIARMPDIWVSVSATTRAPRPGEIDGKDYVFLSPEEFERRVRNGEFLEWAEVHGNRYGTLRSPVMEHLARGEDVVLEIDPQGAAQVKKSVPGSVLIFITAPSIRELERRMRARGAETEEQIKARLETAERELCLVGTYDHVVENDDVSLATDRLAGIIESYRSREQRT